MQESWFSRTELLLGKDKVDLLREKHILIAGVGGVGAFAAEMIVRAGIRKITLIDNDCVNRSNINRQLPALHSNIGIKKIKIMSERLLDINPDIKITTIDKYLCEENMSKLITNEFDYVVDAIDTLTPKTLLINECYKKKINIVSSMGAGGKQDPTKIHIEKLKNTYNCKLALKLRKKLGKMNLDKMHPVVFSSELADKNCTIQVDELNKKTMVGTISYMPAIFGMFCASVVIRDLCQIDIFKDLNPQ